LVLETSYTETSKEHRFSFVICFKRNVRQDRHASFCCLDYSRVDMATECARKRKTEFAITKR
jgi:hypothetical protein